MFWSRKPKNVSKSPDYGDDSDDYNFDDSGGFDDFGVTSKKMTGRDVAKHAGATAIYEVKNKLTAPSEIVKMTKRALPREYRQAFNAYDSTVSEARGLYDSAAKEAKPLIKVLKKTVSKVTPAIDSVLPKTVAEKIKAWTVDNETSYRAPSKEEQRNLAMNAELADFMQMQIKTDAAHRAEDTGKEIVKNTIENMRHKDVVGNLSDINQSTVNIKAFHENLTAKFYHKQLSIGIRQIYLLTDIMEENKKLTAISTTSFEAITKNTSLPEFQKLQMSERFKGLAQNKFMSSLGNSVNKTLFDAQDGVFGDFVTNLKKNTQALIRDKIETYKGMLDQALQADEMMTDAAESGAGGSKGEMVGEMGGAMLGGLVADPIQDRIVKYVAKIMNKNKKIVKLGHQIDYNSRNMGQFVRELFGNIQEKDIPVISKVFGFVNDSMGRAKYDTKLHVDRFGKSNDNINAPVSAFTERFSRSVTDVIPGLLSRMFRELRIIRTGNVEADLIEYNFLSNKFTDSVEIKKDIYNEIFDKDQTKNLNDSGKEMIKKVDPDGTKFTDEERDELMRFLLEEKMKGTYINKEFLSNESSFRGKNSGKFASTFKSMIDNDKTESKINEFDKSLNQFGRLVIDKRSFLQSVINSGRGSVLIELGLIDKNGYIDMKKLYNMILDGTEPEDLLKGYEDSEKNNVPLKMKSGGNKNIHKPARPTGKVANQDVNYLSHETDNRVMKKNEEPILNNAELTKETNACKCEEQFTKLIESTTGILTHLKENSYKEQIEVISGSINEIKEMVAGINNINTDGRWYNKSIGANFKNLVGAGTSLLGGAKDAIKGGLGKAKNLGGTIIDRATEWIDTIKDIKMTGFPEFTLTAMKLRAGHYVDAVTGKVITKFEDIKGDIRDITTNEIVLQYADIGKLYYVEAGGKIKRLFKKGVKKLQLFGFRRYRDLLSLPKKIKELANKTIGKAYTLILDAPCDIFIRKKETPDILTKVMLKKKMENGGYFSALTKKAITRPSMIDGTVIDEVGKEVITTEDVLAGLYNENGKPIKTGFKKLFEGIKGAGKFVGRGIKKAWDFGKEKIGNAWESVKGGASKLFGKVFGVNGFVQINGKKTTDLLTKIFNVLDARLPGGKKKKEAHHIRGSAEPLETPGEGGMLDGAKEKAKKYGSAAREKGSEYFGKAKDKLKEWGGKAAATGSAAGMAISSKYNSVKDNTKEEIQKRKDDMEKKKKEDEEKSKMNPVVAGGLGAAAGAAAWGATKWAVGGALSLAMNLIGWGVGAAGWTLGGALGLAGSAALATLGAIWAVATSPITLGALAVAGIAYGGYKAYQYLTKVKMTNLNKMRCIQYGIDPDVAEKVEVLFDLEVQMEEYVKIDSDGKPDLDMSKIKKGELPKKFGVKKGDIAGITRWSEWFVRRFRPVFLNSIAARNLINVKDKLIDLDDLKPSQKLEYFNYASFKDGPYDELNNPFEKQQLTINKEFVIGWIDHIGKKLEEKTNTKDKAFVAAQVAGKENPYQKKAANEIKKDPNQPDVAGKENANVKEDTDPKLGDKGNPGKTVSVSSNNEEGIVSVDKLEPITAIRLKTYGLVDLNLEKVRSLLKLEYAILKQVTFDNAVATWRGSIDAVVMDNASYFGVVGIRNNDADAWRYWFVNRFLTTFMAFLSALAKNTSSIGTSIAVTNDVLATMVRALSNDKIIDVAFAIYSAKYGAVVGKKEGGASVWNVKQSPWPGYILNNNIKSIDGNMEYIRKSGKTTVIPEATTKESVTAEKKTATESNTNPNTVNNPNKPTATNNSGPGFFGSIANTASNVYNTAKEGVKTVVDSVGYALGVIDNPGHGTKGDVNSLPNPSGPANYETYKDLIDKASAMVGVDPKLMAIMCAIESSFDNKAKPGTSAAAGLYQFIPETWKLMLKGTGKNYGLAPNASVNDPRANTLMGAEYIKQNYKYLTQELKRPLTALDIYLGHFLGGGGAKTFLKMSDGDIPAGVMKKAARANSSIFFKDDKAMQQPRTVGEIKQLLADRMRRKAKYWKIDGNFGGATAAPTAGTPNNTPSNTAATPTTPADVASKSPVDVGSNKPKTPMGAVAQGGGTATTSPAPIIPNSNNSTAPTKANAANLPTKVTNVNSTTNTNSNTIQTPNPSNPKTTNDNNTTPTPKQPAANTVDSTPTPASTPKPTTTSTTTNKTVSIAPSPMSKPKSEAESRKISNTPPAVAETKTNSDGKQILSTSYDVPLPHRLGLTVNKEAPMASRPTENSKAFDSYFNDSNSLSKQQLSSLEIQNAEMKRQTELLNTIANNLAGKGTSPETTKSTRTRDLGNSTSNLPPPLVPVNRNY